MFALKIKFLIKINKKNVNILNILNINMSYISFDVMKVSHDKIRSAYHNLALSKYENLKGICQNIYQGVSNALDMALASKVQLRIQIDNTKTVIDTSDTLIKLLQAQLESSPNPDSIKNEIRSLQQQRDENINFIIEYTKKKSEYLEKEASNIESYEIKSRLEQETQNLNQYLNDKTIPKIKKYEVLKAEAQQNYDDITAAMRVFEEFNLFDFYFDIIPTPEELAQYLDVGMNSTELAAVLLGIKVYTKLSQEVGDSLSYASITRTRDFVRDQIDEYTEELYKWNDEKLQVEKNQNDINHMIIIESELFVFTEQVRNLAGLYTIFADEINLLLTDLGD